MRSAHIARLLALAAPLAAVGTTATFVSAAGAQGTSHDAIATVELKKTSLGTILVDGRGRTLYLFEKDKGKSTCSGSCASFWPPLLTTGKPHAGNGVRGASLSTTKRSDGKLQVSYAGHPLYSFVEDKKSGQTTGQGSDNFGALWYVVGAGGRAVTSAGGGAGGYG